ncbi:MAG: molybdopterin-dependent oxidoreductase [Anaerolineae bacterium]|nr:molybdopterin-dependent oxidoreductase [Anaerolineae bacterium]
MLARAWNAILPDAPAAAVRSAEALYTPTSRFYHELHNQPPRINPEHWSLYLGAQGSVPLILSYSDLAHMPHTTLDATLVSIGWRAGGEQIGHARWQGVPLSLLLDEFGADRALAHSLVTRADGRTASMSRKQLESGLLAFAINGEPLPDALGFPARLIVPGLYDFKMPGWVTRIELADHPFAGFWEQRGWSASGDVQTLSMIETPRADERVSGAIHLSGIAYAGMRRVTQVEISIDNSDWTSIPFEASAPGSWSRWAFDWEAPAAGRYSLRVRATDESGFTQQDTDPTAPFPNGSSAIHRIAFEVAEPA